MKITSIAQYLEEYRKIWPFSGTIGVIQNNKIIFQKAYGYMHAVSILLKIRGNLS